MPPARCRIPLSILHARSPHYHRRPSDPAACPYPSPQRTSAPTALPATSPSCWSAPRCFEWRAGDAHHVEIVGYHRSHTGYGSAPGTLIRHFRPNAFLSSVQVRPRPRPRRRYPQPPQRRGSPSSSRLSTRSVQGWEQIATSSVFCPRRRSSIISSTTSTAGLVTMHSHRPKSDYQRSQGGSPVPGRTAGVSTRPVQWCS